MTTGTLGNIPKTISTKGCGSSRGVTMPFNRQSRDREDSEAEAESGEKNPTTAVALPAERCGAKDLAKGRMKWRLSAPNHSQASLEIDFLPDKDKVDAKSISFLQTVVNKVGAGRAYPGGTVSDPSKNQAKYLALEEAKTKRRIDHMLDTENDPFYGAEWDQASKRWKPETAPWKIGESVRCICSSSASMSDDPTVPWAREGKGDTETTFETVPTVLETREPLGSLKWGFRIKDEAQAPIELVFGEDEDCTDAPTAAWGRTVDTFYAGKYEAILDGFDSTRFDLKPDHKTKLDGIAMKMAATASLNVQLGGACDHTEACPQALSLKRAEAAREYLVTRGIDAERIEVQSYGADWARVETDRTRSERKNRRVQVLLR